MGPSGNANRQITASRADPAALLEAVIETSDDAMFTFDSKGRITSWSLTAERLFGCPAVDVLDGPFDLLFPEHLRHEVQVVIATVLAGDRIRHYDTEVQRVDGMPIPISLSLCPVFDGDQIPVASVVIARDITEQRLTQATLAEVEVRLMEEEALAHVGSWLWDLRTGAVQWSAEFHRIHCVDPLDFDGTFESHLALIHAEDRERLHAAMTRSVVSGRPFECEYRLVGPDRPIHVVRLRAQPTMGSAGTVVGLRGIGQDVTERAVAGVSHDPRGG